MSSPISPVSPRQSSVLHPTLSTAQPPRSTSPVSSRESSLGTHPALLPEQPPPSAPPVYSNTIPSNYQQMNTTRTQSTGPSPTSSLPSGPSRKDSAMITSIWGIGWQTPSLLIGSYVCAVLLAVTHLLLFLYLDGREADAFLPQSYISTASNLLANTFGFCLRAALAVAFVQYLWFLLRLKTMKVSTIELLFNIRSNIFVLCQVAALKAAPFLFFMAMLIWVLQVVTGFPPGALTVVADQQTSYEMIVVPSFNASFMGNGSGADANFYSLKKLNLEPPIGFSSGDFQSSEGRGSNLINRLGRQVLNSGETFHMGSPCGHNCAYSTQFEGPWVTCTTSTTTAWYNGTILHFPIYSGSLSAPGPPRVTHSRYNGTYTTANFTTTILTPLLANIAGLQSGAGYNATVLMQEDTTVCIPGRARFSVDFKYADNILSRNFSVEPAKPLINLALQSYDSSVKVPGFNAVQGFGYGTAPANWSDFALSYYRDNNMMTIFIAMTSWLNGEFIGNPKTSLPEGSEEPASGFFPKEVLMWAEELATDGITGLAYSTCVPTNGNIIDTTRFNAAFGAYSITGYNPPNFNVTQDLMNEYLFNMTLSMMIAYRQWDTRVNSTQTTQRNVYSFSQPLSLILPYFISLGVALPFMLIGFWALLKNGVSATDGSFMQIITTSTGSAILDKAAAGGCLGGEESAPKELKDLKIRFGELIGREDPGRIKRAGFGAEEEIVQLRKGANYGIARWI